MTNKNKTKKILPPGIEPGTYRVLGGRHNQLDQGSSYVLYPGFEPGLSLPQSEVLTTILIQLLLLPTTFTTSQPHYSNAI